MFLYIFWTVKSKRHVYYLGMYWQASGKLATPLELENPHLYAWQMRYELLILEMLCYKSVDVYIIG